MSTSTENELEFRSTADDAWYTVFAVGDGHGKRLTIKYKDFPESENEVFEPSMFRSLEELEEFERRFRPVSAQLQDSECSKAVVGLHVCVCHSRIEGDSRFYDAVVDHVFNERHSLSDCLCTFVLTWQHGPYAGIMMEKKIDSICVVQSSETQDPNVALFLKISREKIVKKCAEQSVSQTHASEGWVDDANENDKQDTDLGFADNYLILLENLEKDLSPSTIAKFIHQQTSIASQSYVFPGSSKELYARGAIVLNTQKDLQALCKFFNNPGHIIISSRGRPWVVAGILSSHDILAPTVTSKIQNGNTGICHEVKLAYSGTEEFKKAEMLRDLHKEFSFHQELQHKKLAKEEKKILQPLPPPAAAL